MESLTINTLPAELLTAILTHLHSFPQQCQNLVNCCLVSRKWHDSAIPILYRHLFLQVGPLTRFLKWHDHAAIASFTQSVSLSLSPPRNQARVLDNELLQVLLYSFACDVVPKCKILSLSLRVEPGFPSMTIFGGSVLAILRVLPSSCVDLELDLAHHFVDEANSKIHLCEEIRAVLPRLRRARIITQYVCSALLGTVDPKAGFQPISLPKIESLSIDCTWPNYGSSLGCINHHSRAHPPLPPSSWYSITEGLKQIKKRGTINPSGEIIAIGIVTPRDQTIRDIHRTIFRFHLYGGGGDNTPPSIKIWACPHVAVPPPNFDDNGTFWYIRAHRGGFVVIGQQGLYNLAEDGPWRSAPTGARLALHPCGGIEEYQSGQVMTEAYWRKWCPRKQCLLWLNERRTGMQLLRAEERLDADLTCIVEDTPDGWHRPDVHERGVLVKDGEDDYGPLV